MSVKRSHEMQVCAYYLSRCSKGGSPPSALATEVWKDAYLAFFSKLGGGRTPDAFRRSLDNARAAFETHMPGVGRRGRVTTAGPPHRKDKGVDKVFSDWGGRSDAELEAQALKWVT